MDKNLLDNMSGQELKEMINDEIITLEDLDNTALEKILDFETDMLCFGTGDMTTIRRCSELLNKRNDSDVLNKDTIISIIDKVKREHVIIVDEEKTQESKAKVIRGKHIILRKIGLVAAITAVLMSVSVLVAAAFGVNILEYISKIVRQDEGSQINVDGFTFYHNGEARQYSSIEEMIVEENLNIMYPTKWPEGIELDSVRIANGNNGNTIVQFYTNDINTNLEIEMNAAEIYGNSEEIYVYRNIIFKINHNDIFVASCHYRNSSYYICANSKKELITIIDNLKE